MAPVEKESASARPNAGSSSGSGSGEGRTFQYSRHLAVVAVGCLLLLARDFLNTSGDARESVKDNKASVPTPSPNTVATTRAQSSGADAVVVNNNLDVPESQMKFLDTSSGGKSAQRLFMEENSVGHRVQDHGWYFRQD